MTRNSALYGLISIIIAALLLALAFRTQATRIIETINQTFSDPAPVRGARLGLQDPPLWPVSELDWQVSPVDLSFLNAAEKPAGRRGFVKVLGESLVFEDGTPARFWGANLSAYSLFLTTKENVRAQARRISALGFNLARIHHHDSPWVNPNIFGKDSTDTQTLDPASLNKIDWWIKCLKDEGIYVWLDLHVQRALTEGDHIRGFDEIRKDKTTSDLKGYNYVNPDIRDAMKRFNEAYLNHVNTYTGVALKNEPAVMALLITNENDVTHHYGNALLPDKKVPLHNQLFMERARSFASSHDLPADKVWRAWEPGPAKIFLNDLEHDFFSDMILHLHSMGVRAPIATTSIWGDEALYSLPSLTTGDIIDAHAYGEPFELEKDPITTATMVNWLSMAQVAGKPMSVTEWNVSPFPVPDRHVTPLLMASAARQQGWDAVMLYAYAQTPPNNAGTPTNWNAFNDPALVATLPAAALLYRRGHVSESATTYAITPDRKQIFHQAISPENSIAARTASEKGKLVVVMPEITELPWLKSGKVPPGAKVIRELDKSSLTGNDPEVSSDSGELRRNWKKGIFTIDTQNTQAAMGMLGDERITLSDVLIDIKTRNATVAVQSLDGRPIGESSNLMISLGAQSVPVGKSLPFHTEPVLGRLTIRAAEGLSLSKSSGTGKEDIQISVMYRNGRYEIDLEETLRTSWLFLKK